MLYCPNPAWPLPRQPGDAALFAGSAYPLGDLPLPHARRSGYRQPILSRLSAAHVATAG
jgi:hypothetical protein